MLESVSACPSGTPASAANALDAAWALCRALADRRRAGTSTSDGTWRLVASAGDRRPALAETSGSDPSAAVVRRHGRWSIAPRWSGAAADLLDLYLPLLTLESGERLAIAHLGQSIDGRIATRTGHSCQLSGQDNLDHLHRLRALADAVLVGAATARLDDPRLTTRRVPGDSPTRVVIDPSARLPDELNLFRDEAASTLIACCQAAAPAAIGRWGRSRVIAVDARDGGLDLPQLLDRLAERGIVVTFVEGGGVTVTRFYEAGCLDRLQIAVSPLIVGDGRAGIQLPGVSTIGDCARPACRVFRMGEDLLWDFDLRTKADAAASSDPDESGVRRII